ncbi:hypothetical protein BKA70DRAFT_1030449, partial [Coprinopsis sp. MPI-PUGE-AT-0042]
NSFGVFRWYPGGKPSYIPDQFTTLDHTFDGPTFASSSVAPAQPIRAPSTPSEIPTNLFPNASTHIVMDWARGGLSSTLSTAKIDSLVRDVILNPDLKAKELEGFRADKEFRRMDTFTNGPSSWFPVQDPWKQGTVSIPMPCTGRKHSAEDTAPKFTVDGVQHRGLLPLITSALEEQSAEQFHLFPFKEFHTSSSDLPPD